MLQQAVYQTLLVGKWHLQSAPTGFDYYNILIGQGPYYNPRMIENGDTLDFTGYSTDLITDIALQSLGKRDAEKPFSLLYHHKAPHRNWMPAPKYRTQFKNQTFPLPETFYDDYATRSAAAKEQDMRIEDMYLSYDLKLLPGDFEKDDNTGGMKDKGNPLEWWKNDYERLTPEQKAAWDAGYEEMRLDFREKNLQGKDLTEWKCQRYLQDHLASVASVDENIGRLLHYLDSTGLAKNTLVVYTSDQGFYLGEHGWYDKRFMYEPSLRMPLVVRYPAGITDDQVSDAMALNLDFAPTFLDFAGVPIPPDMQGRSLRPIPEGKTPADWRNAMYYQYFESEGAHYVKKHYGIRTHRHKLIHFYDGIDAWELFDLEKDPNEVNNVYGDPAYSAITGELKTQFNQLRQELKVPEN
jgi:arylsulfatase A-like enzyme